MKMKMRSSMLWFMLAFVLLALAVNAQDLIFKTGFEDNEDINFAPDIDININPLNPIIGTRSFGEDRDNVADKGIAFMKGMESAGVLSSGKHFPGHGDTATDSHYALPLIEFSKKRLDSLELYPYRKLIKAGLSSVMVAHLNVPS